MTHCSGISYQLQGETRKTPEAIRSSETQAISFILVGTQTSHVTSGILSNKISLCVLKFSFKYR